MHLDSWRKCGSLWNSLISVSPQYVFVIRSVCWSQYMHIDANGDRCHILISGLCPVYVCLCVCTKCTKYACGAEQLWKHFHRQRGSESFNRNLIVVNLAYVQKLPGRGWPLVLFVLPSHESADFPTSSFLAKLKVTQPSSGIIFAFFVWVFVVHISTSPLFSERQTSFENSHIQWKGSFNDQQRGLWMTPSGYSDILVESLHILLSISCPAPFSRLSKRFQGAGFDPWVMCLVTFAFTHWPL